jgi:hypothetical protein
MQSRYVQGAAVPVYDAEVSKAVEKAVFDGGGKTMCFAIENQAGEVYRVIHALGLREYMDLVGGLQQLGMQDRLEQSLRVSAEGYDCRFHF